MPHTTASAGTHAGASGHIPLEPPRGPHERVPRCCTCTALAHNLRLRPQRQHHTRLTGSREGLPQRHILPRSLWICNDKARCAPALWPRLSQPVISSARTPVPSLHLYPPHASSQYLLRLPHWRRRQLITRPPLLCRVNADTPQIPHRHTLLLPVWRAAASWPLHHVTPVRRDPLARDGQGVVT